MPWHLESSEDRMKLSNPELEVKIDCCFSRTYGRMHVHNFSLWAQFSNEMSRDTLLQIVDSVKEYHDKWNVMPESKRCFRISSDGDRLTPSERDQKNYPEYLFKLEKELIDILKQSDDSKREMCASFQEMRNYVALQPLSLQSLCVSTLFPPVSGGSNGLELYYYHQDPKGWIRSKKPF